MCDKTCTLGTREHDGSYCKLTAFQTAGPAEELHINVSRPLQGGRKSSLHWAPISQKVPKAKKTDQHSKRVRNMLHTLYTSDARKQITRKARHKVTEKMKALMRKRTVASYYAALEYRQKMGPMMQPVPASVPEEFALYIIAQTDRIRNECSRRNIPCKRTDASLVLGLVHLLSTGFAACGATLIPQSNYVRTHSLSLQQYGLLPNIRARSQTISTRLVKRAILTDDGEPLLVLPDSPV